MQTIFAFQQCREANYGIALEFIKESFAPDLNSMEVQDKELLKAQAQEARQVFKENYKNKNFKSTAGSADRINEVVDEALRDYYQQIDKDFRFFKKNMVAEAEKILDRYISVLNLIIEFAQLAEDDTRQDHRNFVKNLLIKALKFNKSLENISLRRNISWANDKAEVRQWFKDLVKTDAAYNDYLKATQPDFEEDKAIITHLLKNIVFKSDLIDKHMEESDLNWDEDRPIVKSLATKTIKSMTPESGEDFELQELSYNWEDDKSFFIRLFEETIKVEAEFEDLIAKKTKNWDIERIAITDKIILEMAICEMINFPSIPVKVTINEYIEVAKRYSTPKSKTFINGVLDVIAEELTSSGTVKKSGRGLIDNK
ncbi:Transcription termination protein NusB [Fulvivirga imtechensis AK7]|uniref:Transcription antitermination protein NusB n=1 Tax=Fulvivirga imtechensis AK7 TaxID=1237149 RepID=L8JPD4_9BACT|nr:transcription antitermination factor NusB [Fulvivirga imtechensis]ELR70700.1 Transcription termination protein NusB [Fulvivirga imtechensis AK7]